MQWRLIESFKLKRIQFLYSFYLYDKIVIININLTIIMNIERLKNIEEIWNYTFELLTEIARDIDFLSKFSSRNPDNDLDMINKKLDYARKKWLNVDVLDKKFLDFRVILFKRRIENKMQELKSEAVLSNYFLDTTKIQKEFEELKKETNIDIWELFELMNNLSNNITILQIKKMVASILNTEEQSIYTLHDVAEKIEEAKEKGVDVSDIEDEIYA
jgi:hypothetical protein